MALDAKGFVEFCRRRVRGESLQGRCESVICTALDVGHFIHTWSVVHFTDTVRLQKSRSFILLNKPYFNKCFHVSKYCRLKIRKRYETSIIFCAVCA